LYKPNLESNVRAAEAAPLEVASAAPAAVGVASATAGAGSCATAVAKTPLDWESAGIKFPDNSNKWKCGMCWVSNERANARCVCCSTLSPEETLRAAAPTPVPAPAGPVGVSACAPVLVAATSTSLSGANNMPEPMMWSPILSIAHTAVNMVAVASGTCHGGYMAGQHFQAPQLQMPQLQAQPMVGVVGGWVGATGGQLGCSASPTAPGGTTREFAVLRCRRPLVQQALPTPAWATGMVVDSAQYSFNIGAGPAPGESKSSRRTARRGNKK
ncbi:hypothetical protein BGZ58_005904, partial [Dissophora ornata]